ncbi:FtsW/RodA/SpoVE family cell cycle protein [Ideonella sp. YS5]|uniref:FtsW/RodA/SpoVE family cell cycle protein n=1 Tax=Ideonella sp. YS5 TaxID=3453714 RepID=UPI003F6FE815
MRRSAAWMEVLGVLLAIACWWPAFDRMAGLAEGRDQRFAVVSPTAEPAAAALADRKNLATRFLYRTAAWQWAGAMGLGYLLLLVSRRPWPKTAGVALALGLWAFAAWLGRVPWPLAGAHAFEPARVGPAWSDPPAPFVWWLLGAAALAGIVALAGSGVRARPRPAQAMSSRLGYPGLVLATGLGGLLLLDLSANGHPGNRYLALYHQGHLWLGMLVFSVVLFLRQPISRALGFALSLLGEAARGVSAGLGRPAALAGLILVALAGVLAFGMALSSMRQLTSELGRVWLIVGAAWFFFLRAAPLAERLARSGTAGGSFWRYLGPLLFVAGVLVAVMVITRDMGPLLIAGYASGAFVAASVALWWHLRAGQRAWAMLLAVLLFALWIVGVTAALFAVGTVDSVTATRLESLSSPYASVNDQSALVAWFQRATPAAGFGLGNVPWCGYAPVGSCSGVPAQIHSDYTFTAIHGVFGPAAAWAASLACALWLHRLIRHHGRVTRGEPGYVAAGPGRMVHDDQALLSWMGVAWVALTFCQLAVTVAGNLAVLPLTGVTFPFVSFGMTSLVVNLAFLALCINVDVPPRGSHG